MRGSSAKQNASAADDAVPASREYVFTQQDFEFLRKLSNDLTGIVVTDDKYDMFYSRLSRRVRTLRLRTFAEYCDYLREPNNSGELEAFVNALTTNLTAFFRENHHFDFLRDTALPEAVKRNAGSRQIKIWSAGCSTGEEPYSIAITLKENEALYPGWNLSILASDIDSDVLEKAAGGIYAQSRIEGLSGVRLKRFFLRGKGAQQGRVRVQAPLRRMIAYQQINLMQRLDVEQQDIIFCRNVIIYFDRPTKQALVAKFADQLPIGGYLIVGHSETLQQVTDRFELVGHTVYRKVK